MTAPIPFRLPLHFIRVFAHLLQVVSHNVMGHRDVADNLLALACFALEQATAISRFSDGWVMGLDLVASWLSRDVRFKLRLLAHGLVARVEGTGLSHNVMGQARAMVNGDGV